MAYGTVKVDNITFDNGGSDQNVTVSGLYNSLTSGVSVTGTISGSVVIGSTSVSGTTVLGTAVTGTTVQGVSGTFTSLTGTTITGTTINAVTVASTTGTFTSLTGTTITGTAINGVTVAATTGSFTSLTGTTTSGTTANFVSGVFTTQISGATVTGTTANFTSGNFTNISGGTHTITSGVFAAGSATNPSISFTSDPNTGIFSPGADQVAISTNGSNRLYISSAGNVGIGPSSAISSPTAPLTVIGADDSTQAVIGASTGSTGRGLRIATATNVSNNDRVIFDAQSTTGAPDFRWRLAGSEKMALDSSGRLGLGTTDPGARFEVRGISGGTSAEAVIRLRDQFSGAFTAQTDNCAIEFFSTDTNGPGSMVRSKIANTVEDTTGAAQALTFSTTTNTSGQSLTERLRITHAGNVGIGTTSPSQILHVAGNSSSATFAGQLIGDANERVRIGYKTGGPDTGLVCAQIIQDTNVLHIASRDTTNGAIIFNVGAAVAERARIDSSGRLLVGTSTARSNFDGNTATPLFQIEGVTAATASASVVRGANDATGSTFNLGKTRATAVGGNTVVSSGDQIGIINFQAADGTNLIDAASIQAAVDGTPGTDDMPGRLVFSVTLDGAASPTEALRITNDRVVAYNQAAPAAVNATATLTVDNLKNGIITSTTAAAVTMTLPTGTLTEGGFRGVYTNMTFEWSVINTGATNAVTVQGGTGHTLVGSGAVAAGTSGRFASRRTAANTFVSYRLS
jgi:hypothetical protein